MSAGGFAANEPSCKRIVGSTVLRISGEELPLKPPRLPGPRLALGAKTSDRSRLLFLGVVMVLFIGGFAYLRVRSSETDPVSQQESLIPAEVVRPRAVRIPSAQVDHALLIEVRDASRSERLVREPTPYGHLIAQARRLTTGDMEALGLQKIDAAAILEDPALHRGHAYEVKGILEQLEIVQGADYQEVRGTLLDVAGQRYAFTVLHEPEASVGEVVRLRGFFYKLFAIETAPGEYDDQAIYLVGRNLPRTYLEMAPTTDLADAPLYQVSDFDITDMIDMQEDVLYHVLNFVRSLSPEARQNLDYEDVEWSDLRRDPERYRGRPVRVFANYYPSLEWVRVLGPDGENPLETPAFHDGILKLPHERIFRWIGFDPVPDEAIGDSRLVFLKGIFFKNYAWENSRGDILNAPLIVATGFEPFRVGENHLVEGMGYVIVGITTLLVLIFFIGVFNDRRESNRFRSDYLRRKKRQLGGRTDPRKPGDASASTQLDP